MTLRIVFRVMATGWTPVVREKNAEYFRIELLYGIKHIYVAPISLDTR